MTIEELTDVTLGIKAEALDIKEVLADYDDRIKDISNSVEQTQLKFNQQLNNELSNYMSSVSIEELYYDKNEIDEKINNLNYIEIDDVKNLLLSGEYVTYDNIKNFVNINNLNTYFDTRMEIYPTLDVCKSTFATKEEIENITDNNIDLSDYVSNEYLNNNYYTKSEVERLIPSTIGFVKKSELYSLLPLDEYALTDWVNEKFIKKDEIFLDKYVTQDMLNKELSKFDNNISENSLETILKDYVKISKLDNDLKDLSRGIYDYIPLALDKYKKDNELLTKSDVKGYVTIEQLKDYIINDNDESIDISEFITESDLKNYDFVNTESLKTSLLELKYDISENIISTTLNEIKSDYATKNYAMRTFATKDELRNFILSDSPFDETILNQYVKSTELDNYIDNVELNDKLNDIVEIINNKYIPNSLTSFKLNNNFATQKYVDVKFATKDELRNFISDYESNDIDVKSLVRKPELNKYMLKSDMSDYVMVENYNSNLTSLNSNISTIKSSLQKYVLNTKLAEYIKVDDIDSYFGDYVTKDYLSDELSKLNNIDVIDIDLSNYITRNEFNDSLLIKLNNYYKKDETYSKSEILDKLKAFFVPNDTLSQNYYDKKDVNNTFLSLNDASKYLTVNDAYIKFLSKEDYRGIKDAMTLNSAYKNSKEIFEALLDDSKLLDGFYIVDDNVVIVKNNVAYETNLTGSDSYTKNEIDEKHFVTEEYLKDNYQKNVWIIDKGGRY